MLRRNRWDEQTRVPLEEDLSELEKLLVAAGHVDIAEVVLAPDSVDIMLASARSNEFDIHNLEVHDSVISFDAINVHVELVLTLGLDVIFNSFGCRSVALLLGHWLCLVGLATEIHLAVLLTVLGDLLGLLVEHLGVDALLLINILVAIVLLVVPLVVALIVLLVVVGVFLGVGVVLLLAVVLLAVVILLVLVLIMSLHR